MMIADQT